MEFKNIRNELKKESEQRLSNQLDGFGKISEHHKTKEDVLNWCVRWVLDKRTSYKGTYEEQKNKVIIALRRKYDKEFLRKIDYLKQIENATDKINEFYITVEWAKGSMRANQATATDSLGNTSGKTGGCGYCKESTVTARILNQHLNILHLMCIIKDVELMKNKNITNRECLEYGAGYSLIPNFEGGVGVSSHMRILEKLGLKMQNISSTKTTDTYKICRVV